MCETCAVARAYPSHRTFCPACIYCGARYFQMLRSFPPVTVADGEDGRAETKAERQEWRGRVLRTWADMGHDVERLKELAGAAEAPLQPIGTGAPAAPIKKRAARKAAPTPVAEAANG